MKDEPEWMLKFRLKALRHFNARPMPNWGADLSEIDFSNIFYYLKPQAEQGKSWDDIPTDIKNTFDRLASVSSLSSVSIIGRSRIWRRPISDGGPAVVLVLNQLNRFDRRP